MIIELLQFWQLITKGIIYCLVLHFLFFVISPLVFRGIRAKKYSPYQSLRQKVKVSVIIPEYGENLNIVERCLDSVVRNQPDEIIVVHDDGRKDIAELAKRYGAKVYSFPERVGKRKALAQGWAMASGDIIVHADSDEILHENAIKEILNPFDDEKIVATQGRNLAYKTGSWYAWSFSQLIEHNRDICNKALNGHLIVVDGRFNAWRRSWLLAHADQFLNEKFLGLRCEIGDDRFLTAQANLEGYKTVYQETAVAETASPATYFQLVKQQLRWLRSGFKFFFKDFSSRLVLKVSWLYTFLQICLYVASISFTLAIIYDILFAPPLLSLPLWAILPVAIFGSSTIALIRRLAVGFYKLTPKELLMLGVTGLFVMYPLSLYALLTMRKQAIWGTR